MPTSVLAARAANSPKYILRAPDLPCVSTRDAQECAAPYQSDGSRRRFPLHTCSCGHRGRGDVIALIDTCTPGRWAVAYGSVCRRHFWGDVPFVSVCDPKGDSWATYGLRCQSLGSSDGCAISGQPLASSGRRQEGGAASHWTRPRRRAIDLSSWPTEAWSAHRSAPGPVRRTGFPRTRSSRHRTSNSL